MFYQFLLSPQVKRCAIITYKHSTYELPHELQNELRLRILGNYEVSGNCLKLIEDILVPSPLTKIKILLIPEENSLKTEIKLFPLCAILHEN